MTTPAKRGSDQAYSYLPTTAVWHSSYLALTDFARFAGSSLDSGSGIMWYNVV